MKPAFGLQFLNLKMPEVNTHLLNIEDIKSFLKVSNFDVVRKEKKILVPLKLFGFARILNKYLSTLPIFSFFCLRHYIVARSIPSGKKSVKPWC